MGSTHRVFGYRRVEHRNARDGGSVDRHPCPWRASPSSLGVFLKVNIVCKVIITDRLRCVWACSEHSETCPSSKVYPSSESAVPTIIIEMPECCDP
eukprot:3048154-Prymnesium_polylepis.1